MYLLIIAVVSGLMLGYYSNMNIRKQLNKAYLIIIALLLFAMGISIGSNKEMLSSAGSIGIVSFVMAVFGMAGSVIFVKSLEKLKIIRIGK